MKHLIKLTKLKYPQFLLSHYEIDRVINHFCKIFESPHSYFKKTYNNRDYRHPQQ